MRRRIWPQSLLVCVLHLLGLTVSSAGPQQQQHQLKQQHFDEVLNPPEEVPAFALPDGPDKLFTGLYSGPYFDPSGTPQTVETQVGADVLLPCRVKQANGRAVSWIRVFDSAILSAGNVTFVSDRRVRLLRPESGRGHEWNLHIRSVSAADAGDYECQISNSFKMSHTVKLIVRVPSVSISGGSLDVHARAGGNVSLVCNIQNVIWRPAEVQWYRNDVLLSPLDRPSVVIEPIAAVSSTSTSMSSTSSSYSSRLLLPSARPEQSGRFQCSPANPKMGFFSEGKRLPSAHVNLHIVNDEKLAAMSKEEEANKSQSEEGEVSSAAAVGVAASKRTSLSSFSVVLTATLVLLDAAASAQLK